MDNPEKLATMDTQDTGQRQRKQINVRENRRGSQVRTIQRNWQHCVHKTQGEDKQENNTENYKRRATRIPPKTGVNPGVPEG